LELRPQLVEEMARYAQEICPDCFVDVTAMVTGYYPDTDAVITLYNVPMETEREVRRALCRRMDEIKKQHHIIIFPSIRTVEQVQHNPQSYERALAKRQQTAEVK
jgi:PHP family Zn ribbon phosphoesterase